LFKTLKIACCQPPQKNNGQQDFINNYAISPQIIIFGYHLEIMAKKIVAKPVPAAQPKPQQKQAAPVRDAVVKDPKIPSWLYEFKNQAIIVAVLAFVFYCNTFSNEVAHDDLIVIAQNEYVLEGFAGIPEIFTKDAYDSYYKQYNSSNQLAGGRYRPLSILTFAIEQQILGAVPKDKMDSFFNHSMQFGVKDPQEKITIRNMHVRHFFNVVWFMLAMVVLLYFLRYIVFRSNPIMALLATVLFVINPIHTEVVANVKSRDEIMSLMFICLTFIYAFRYRENKKPATLGWALLFYLLAFLSKEYAISLLALLPLSFYIFDKETIPKSILATVPYLGVVVIYILLRLQVVGPANPDSNFEILNNPYAFAVGNQKIATEIATSLDYLKLLIVPYPLSADYSYNTIPYKDFSHPLVWLSLLVHGGLVWAFIYFFKRRHVLAFAIAFYMLHLLLICNIVFDIGATMGERLIYHSSLGFVMALSYFLYKGMEKIKPEPVGKYALTGLMSVMIVIFGYITIERNMDWKNDLTLFFKDIEVAPNSVMVNANVAAALIDKADFEKDTASKNADLYRGIELINKAISLHPTYVIAYLNKALSYFKLNIPDSVQTSLDKARGYYPNHPKLPEMYYNNGVTFYMHNQYDKAINSWQIVVKLKPDYTQAQTAINTLRTKMAQPKQAQVTATAQVSPPRR
jgi:tetratricopeptide (TPR) repeat protein